MSKPTILITGANGLIGTVAVRDLADQYAIKTLDLSGNPSIDITDQRQVDTYFASVPESSWVIHFAAFTDVTAAWHQTNDLTGIAYRVNVTGTQHIVNACNQYHKKLLHISTAYVFSGEKTTPYVEQDQPGPVEWYGQTKYLAEQLVMTQAHEWAMLRIDNPFRTDAFVKPDIVRRIVAKLRDGSLPAQFSDATFGSTFIEDLIKVIGWVMRTDRRGLYHVTTNESWTPYNFAQAVAKRIGLDPALVKPGSHSEYLKTANRPYPKNTALDCTKLINELDFALQSVESALGQVIL